MQVPDFTVIKLIVLIRSVPYFASCSVITLKLHLSESSLFVNPLILSSKIGSLNRGFVTAYV